MDTMTIVDFHTIIYLAWMSANVHLSTLTFLSEYFQAYRSLQTIRILSMFVLLVMVCIALFPTTNSNWANIMLTKEGCTGPTNCPMLTKKTREMWEEAMKNNLHGELSLQGIFQYLILIISHLWKLSTLLPERWRRGCSLSTPLLDALQTIIQRQTAKIQHKALSPSSGPISASQTGQVLLRCRIHLLTRAYIFLLAFFDLLNSSAFFLWILLVAPSWTTLQLFIPRNRILPKCVSDTLYQWNFGQILPLLLLLNPIYSALEFLST